MPPANAGAEVGRKPTVAANASAAIVPHPVLRPN
jgi:hypothetical protein